MPAWKEFLKGLIRRKGVPESVLFEKILPGGKLTENDWVLLIDERADLVRWFMDRVRLQKLYDFGYAPSDLGGGCTVSIAGLLRDDTDTVCYVHSLKVEGVFRGMASRHGKNPHRHHVLGFTRNGDWIEADILERPRDGMRHISSIHVSRTTPGAVVSSFRIEYPEILAFLADEFTGWVEKKRDIFERMQRIQSKFALEDRILDALHSGRKEQGR